jgi:hypothetical protein
MYSRKAVSDMQKLVQEQNQGLKILPPKRASDSFNARQVIVMLVILFIVAIATALLRIYL